MMPSPAVVSELVVDDPTYYERYFAEDRSEQSWLDGALDYAGFVGYSLVNPIEYFGLLSDEIVEPVIDAAGDVVGSVWDWFLTAGKWLLIVFVVIVIIAVLYLLR